MKNYKSYSKQKLELTQTSDKQTEGDTELTIDMENTYELCNYRKRNDKKKIIDRHRETSNQIYRDSEDVNAEKQTERKKEKVQ